MLAFHMMHQGPSSTVFPRTAAQAVGTLLMFVVRNIFSRPSVLRETMMRLAHNGEISERQNFERLSIRHGRFWPHELAAARNGVNGATGSGYMAA
jgi:hypothetical protein